MVDLEAVQSFGESLKKNLQCPICLSLLKNPTSGDCLHKFCRVCIDQQIAIRKKPKCPICNKPISRRSLRKTGELRSVLRGVETILTSINSEGAEDSCLDEPVVPFSQFELTTCESPEKVPDKILQKALTTPSSVCDTADQPSTTNTITKPGIVAKTPARKWGVVESSSSSRKRKKTAETDSSKGAENNRMLLETIEKGNLGEKSKSKKCSRKVADDLKEEPKSERIKGPTTKCSSSDEQKENHVTAEARNSVPVAAPLNKNSLLNNEGAVAAKNRALQRLMKNARHVEESGKISNTSLNSTSYQSPKPSSSVSKKVSPFVLKTINKGTPSPDITIIDKPVPTQPSKPGKTVESDEDDSLEIGVKKKKGKKTEIKILSSEDESHSPTTSSHSSDSRRKSLRRKVVKPPIIDDDDDSKEALNVQLSPRDEFEPNTVDILEISLGLRGPSEVFKDSISITNAETRSKPSEKIDVIRIGQHARHNVTDSKLESPNKIEASGKSIEMIEQPLTPSVESQDDDLPSCGLESELNITRIHEKFEEAEEPEQEVKELPKPDLDLSNVAVQPQTDAMTRSLRRSALSRRKAGDLKVLETPNLHIIPRSEPPPAPVTPLLCDVIKSSNTVLETPMIPKRETIDKVLETPIVNMKPKESKKRSIEYYDTKDEGNSQNSAEKRARHDIGRNDDLKSPMTEQKGASDTNKGPDKNYDKKSKTKMKEFINKVSVTPNSKRNDNYTPVARKNAVVEKVYNNPNKDKTSPKLTIDKEGNKTNYTIEKENPAAKLTIIQEGPIMSPKLMKHIYEDFLHSDPNSCDDLINSLTADKENSLNCGPAPVPEPNSVAKSTSMQSHPIEVDHKALIFGQDSVGDSVTDCQDKRAEEMQRNNDNVPDSLEGFTYNNPRFNETEFKKTFGLVNDSLSLADEEKVTVFQEDTMTNICDEVKLSQLSQERERVTDSHPTIVEDWTKTPRRSQPDNPLNDACVFDTVPDKDMTTPVGSEENGVTTVAESVGDFESQTKLHQPLSSSTQHTKETCSPTTPNQTLVSSSGHVYTSQERALIEQQLRETEDALTRLQEIEQAGVAVADTLQPELLIKPISAESSGVQVNETVVEQESFTQGELFDDIGSASNDITICEVDEPTPPSEKKNTVIYYGEEQNSSSKSSQNKDITVIESRAQQPSEGRCSLEINTAELIALNEAAIEGKVARTIARSLGAGQECGMTSADIIGTIETPPTQIEGTPAGAGSENRQKVLSLNSPVNAEVSQLSADHSISKTSVTSSNVKDAPSQRGETSQEERKRSEGEDSGKRAIKEYYIPIPDIIQSDSAASNCIPPSQESSPVLVCRRSNLTATPVKIVNVLLSGMLGKSGSKEAFQLRKSIRGSCKVQFRVLTQYTDAVTHLIFPHNHSMTCPRTAKYFRGIAGGKWILSNQWLVQSYQAKELLNETPYEMQGDTESGRTYAPRSARMARALKHPLLFADTSVYYVGEIRILPRDQFSSLLEAVGVTIVHTPDSASATSLTSYKTQSKVSPLIDSDVTDINAVKESSGVDPITAQWIIECIAVYTVLPPEAIVR